MVEKIAEAGEIMRSFPEWMPLGAKLGAKQLVRQFAADADSLCILQRLANDPRMKIVWTQLGKQRRKDGGAMEPMWAPTLDAETIWAFREELQKNSLESANELFDATCNYVFLTCGRAAVGNPRTITATEISENRQRLERVADNFREGAELCASLGLYCRHPRLAMYFDASEVATALADEIQRTAGLLFGSQSKLFVSERRKDDDRARGFALNVVGIFKKVYDNGFYGTSATIVNVAYDTKLVRGGTVEAWVKSRQSASVALFGC